MKSPFATLVAMGETERKNMNHEAADQTNHSQTKVTGWVHLSCRRTSSTLRPEDERHSDSMKMELTVEH